MIATRPCPHTTISVAAKPARGEAVDAWQPHRQVPQQGRRASCTKPAPREAKTALRSATRKIVTRRQKRCLKAERFYCPARHDDLTRFHRRTPRRAARHAARAHPQGCGVPAPAIRAGRLGSRADRVDRCGAPPLDHRRRQRGCLFPHQRDLRSGGGFACGTADRGAADRPVGPRPGLWRAPSGPALCRGAGVQAPH